MSSTTQDPTHAPGGDLPPDMTLSSTDDSTFLSENGAHNDTESKATTPSATPKKEEPEAVAKSSDPQDAALDLINGEGEDAPSIGPQDRSQSESGSDNSEASRNTQRIEDIYHMARLFRKAEQGMLPPGLQTPELMALVNHVKMMEWLSGMLRAKPSPPSSLDGDYVKRKVSIPVMRKMTWDEYESHSAMFDAESVIDLMIEEIPVVIRGGVYGKKPAVLRARPNGVPILPPVLAIKSLPVRRIVATLTNGKLRSYGLGRFEILRPYKLLACFEGQIRRRLSEIQELCNSTAISSVMGADLDQNKPTTTDILTELSPREEKIRDGIIFTPEHDWNHLTAEERKEAASDLGVLVSFLDEYISPLRNGVRDEDGFQLYFQELWHVFPPGSIVYVKDPVVPQKLWRVVQATGGEQKASPAMARSYLKLGGTASEDRWPPLRLECYHLDFDGTNFVRVFKTFQVEHFEDLSSVSSLSIIPLNSAAKDGFINIDAMVRRGEEFISYTRWSYSYYRGRSLIHEPDGATLCNPQKGTMSSSVVLSEAVESPVVVDFERCLQEVPAWKPARTSINLSKLFDDEKEGVLSSGYDDDRMWDVQLAEKVLNYTDQTRPIELHGQDPPSGDDVLLFPNRVFAFILRTRKWACLPLGSGILDNQPHSLTRMNEDHLAWDSLQIDDGHRAIIKSLMATHFRKKKSERRQFDIIQDKGKGLIILLHGVPGVGKTSTAETVAQYYNKPLLPITCGDLGTTPAEVEDKLQSSFQMAQAWDCVLLLDEADVFLAERSHDNIERNALVSVFLRVMEYYEGILFLTTNKVGAFDEAFKSRMSMALYYPPLTQEQTRKIWEMQMDRTETVSKQAAPEDESQHIQFNRNEVATLSATLWINQMTRKEYRPVWNGRQIRNAFQTAVALAEWHKRENRVTGPIVVRGEHFDKVARVSNDFNAYLYEVKHGRADNARAHKMEHRYDDFNRQQFGFGGQGAGFGQDQQQQGYGMPGFGQGAPQQGGAMPYGGAVMYGGGQAGATTMAGGVAYGNNMLNPGAFLTNQGLQPGGYVGVSNTGMGGLNTAGLSTGTSGGGNGMGAGLSPGSVNVQVLPSHSIQGQMNNPQQQQQQQSGSTMGPGGPMVPGYR